MGWISCYCVQEVGSASVLLLPPLSLAAVPYGHIFEATPSVVVVSHPSFHPKSMTLLQSMRAAISEKWSHPFVGIIDRFESLIRRQSDLCRYAVNAAKFLNSLLFNKDRRSSRLSSLRISDSSVEFFFGSTVTKFRKLAIWRMSRILVDKSIS